MKLIIAEKPSVAGEIAKIVGARRSEHGYKTGNGYIVSWCVGHLIELAQPEAYDANLKKWSLDTLPIIPETYKMIVSGNTKDQYKILKDLINRDDVTELVCATDAGREGELIFRLVYNQTGCKKPFKRLWISSMEEKSIVSGLNNIKDGTSYDNLYKAALCRQRADWLLGINLTRLYSKLNNRTLTCGRVQTPTINLIVQRQAEIENFIPQIFYNVIADFGKFEAKTKVDDKMEAERILALCEGKKGTVAALKKERKRENPEALYDLTTLQRDANRMLGFTAQETLAITQLLYEAKLVTYPRTDSRYITADMAVPTQKLINSMIAQLNTIPQDYKLEDVRIERIVNDTKVTDHHAIIPTVSMTPEALDKLKAPEKNISLMIINRLLEAPYRAYDYTLTKAEIKIGREVFKVTGKEVLDSGFKALEKGLKNDLGLIDQDAGKSENSKELPPLSEGDEFDVSQLSCREGKTQPPRSYTEDTLLAAMETAGRFIEDETLKDAMKDSGLGTPATRAEVIENIIRKDYVIRDKKNLTPTETAKIFIGLVTEKVKQPELTADWEKKLAEIQRGERTEESFMGEVTGFLDDLIAEVKKSSPESAFQKIEREPIGICPRCGKRVIEYQSAYSCESGKKGCGFEIWKQTAGKDISKSQAEQLLTNSKTDMLRGFKSKAGKSFNAYLAFNDEYQVVFEFEKSKKGRWVK